MPYIIAEPCIGTCDTACVPVCPVDCIHGPLTLDEIDDIKDEHGENAPQRVPRKPTADEMLAGKDEPHPFQGF